MSSHNRYADLIKSDYMLENDLNCAETMIRGANEAYRLGLPERALRLAAPFGGGMGREGACGALTGALMALGALRSAGVSHQDPELERLRDEFVRRFEARFGSIECSEIKPVHRTKERSCSSVVEVAAEIMEELLGGTNITMIRPHLREIPQHELPAGYTIRGMRVEDIGLWTDIQRDAEEFFEVKDSLFREQFGDDLEAIGDRCFLLIDPNGTAVGTASAWYDRDFHGGEWGRIHWVAIRPSHQGQGLSRGLLTHAMNVLARNHERAYLSTDTRRTAAVHLYETFGFCVETTGG